ncbi:MAG: mechanosensitive ion channel family protein [Bryobacteraceae bacterium]
MIQIVGPNHALQLFGVKLVGVNAENGKKLLFSIGLIVFLSLLGRILHWAAHRETRDKGIERVAFWARQGISITLSIVAVIGLMSIWFDNATTLTTAAGLVAAGLAFALQKVVTAFAGYLLILRGKTFSVGDRITMGGVRGDVVALNFLQTVIMEMGQPAQGDSGDPAWIQARQYTGRIVRISNSNIFDEPVYNYTREFPYIWEEMRLPVSYNADRYRAEHILLEATRKHTIKMAEMSEEALKELENRYVLKRSELEPCVYWRLTDNWLELTVRFIVTDYGIRDIKSKISRDLLAELDRAGIGIASGTYEVVGMPPIKVQMIQTSAPGAAVPHPAMDSHQ